MLPVRSGVIIFIAKTTGRQHPLWWRRWDSNPHPGYSLSGLTTKINLSPPFDGCPLQTPAQESQTYILAHYTISKDKHKYPEDKNFPINKRPDMNISERPFTRNWEASHTVICAVGRSTAAYDYYNTIPFLFVDIFWKRY